MAEPIKHFKTYGDGTEHLEGLMNAWSDRRPSAWDASTKYVKAYMRAKELGERTSDDVLQEIYAKLEVTFRAKTSDMTEAARYMDAFRSSWPVMLEVIRANSARGMYFLDKVVDSISFYDALRRIHDPEIPNATVLEAAFAVTYDIAGKYGKLDLDDPSTLFDMFEPIMVEDRWRTAKVVEKLQRLAGRRERSRVFPGGFGLGPEYRHFGFTLDQIRRLDIVGVDRDYHQKELDETFQYAHGVNFADTGIQLIQGEITDFVKQPEHFGAFDYAYMMGVMSYTEDDSGMCDLMDGALRVLKPGADFDFDLQVVDDSLRRVAMIFGWCEDYPLRPEATPEAAIERVNRVCRECDAELAEYEVDPRNDPAVGICFTVRRH